MVFKRYVEKISNREKNLRTVAYKDKLRSKKKFNNFVTERDNIMKKKDVMLKYNFALDKKLKNTANDYRTKKDYIYIK